MRDKTRTPQSTLITARNIAIKSGIKFCYVGNVRDLEGQTTYCPNCNTPLIKRDWHDVFMDKLENGKCYKCKTIIPGMF